LTFRPLNINFDLGYSVKRAVDYFIPDVKLDCKELAEAVAEPNYKPDADSIEILAGTKPDAPLQYPVSPSSRSLMIQSAR
jgi:hypothetical protein